MDLNLKGRVAFVTGASRGIGRSIAFALAAEGVHIGLFGRDIQRCNEVEKELHVQRPDICTTVVELDLVRRETIGAAVTKAVAGLGRVDILINCAGGAYRGRLEEIPDHLWEQYFTVKPARTYHRPFTTHASFAISSSVQAPVAFWNKHRPRSLRRPSR